jgi:phage gpG-like protein
MSGPMVQISVDDHEINLYFMQMSAKVHEALLKSISSLAVELAEYVRGSKLSGQVLNIKSSALISSIESFVEDKGASVTGGAFTDGLHYARIHEYGGPIDPVRGEFLRFIGREGKEVFLRHVDMPERSYMRSSLREMKEVILAEIEVAVDRAVGARL